MPSVKPTKPKTAMKAVVSNDLRVRNFMMVPFVIIKWSRLRLAYASVTDNQQQDIWHETLENP
jgi:hypothetical protein